MDEQLPELADLVLQTRLVMLRGSLTKVCDAIKMLEKARQQGSQAAREDSGVAALAHAIGADEARLREVVERITDATIRFDAISILNDMSKKRGEAVISAAEPPGRRFFALRDTSVGGDLSDYARDQLGELDEIESKIDQATGKPADEAHQLMDDAWQDYRKVLITCHEIFAEYIDLIRGVLLRDAGLDQDLCRIADTLIKTWHFADHAWSSLSIPAEGERPGMSTAQLIRLGFPEWTIWSLPLIAREFGHVFAQKRERVKTDIKDAIAQNVATKPDLCSWAADVFATTVLGSAYLWAATLLRADPGEPGDRTRVAVMTHTLELMNAPTEFYQPLAEAWQIAAGGQADLSEGQKAFVKKVKSRIGVEFRRWEEASALADRLQGTDELNAIANSLAVSSLRNVLVAVWRVRIGRALAFDAHSYPEERPEERIARRRQYADDLITIADRVRAVCVTVIDRPESALASGLPGTGLPPPQGPAADGPNPGPDKSSGGGGSGI
jgi:hypothetical protein